MTETSLEKLKKKYEELKTKHNLPSFQQLNEDFEIEKLQERETDTLSREVRRCITDRIITYIRFVEMFMNPANAPMFFLALVKGLDESEKKLLHELYSELGKFEIKSISLDNEYEEARDAKFIKESFDDWQKIKSKFGKILDSFEKAWEKKSAKKDTAYLG